MSEPRLVLLTSDEAARLQLIADHEDNDLSPKDHGLLLALADARFDRGITEEEARLLGDHPATLAPTADEPGTFAYRICQAVPKLRDAFSQEAE